MIKYIFSLITFSLISISTYSQGWVFSKAIQSSDLIEPKFSVTDDEGNNYILAHFKDTIREPLVVSNGNYDLIILKLSPDGDLLWQKQIGGTGLENAGSLIFNNNELFVIVNFQNTIQFSITDFLVSNGSFDVGLCKFSAINGDYIDSKLICTSNGVSDGQVVVDAKIHNSSIIITGNFTNQLFVGVFPNRDTLNAAGFNTSFISELDLQGNIIWSKRILPSTNFSRTSKITVSNDGYYFGGFYRGNLLFDVGTITSYTSGFNDNFIYKTNFDGDGQWIRRIFGAQTENIQSLIADEYNNIYALGNYGSPQLFIDSTSTAVADRSINLGNFDTYICKYNRSGVLQWLVLKGSNGRDIYNDFIRRDSLIYATGYFTNQLVFNNDTIRTTDINDINNSDAFLASFNQLGDAISGISILGTGNYEDAGTIVKMDANSRAYVSGYFKSPQIQIGNQTYTSNNINKSDLFFAIYQQQFKAVITKEKMVTCFGLSDGMLTVTPYFGRSPYTYSWSHNPSLNNPVANNLAAGDYTVTITDANNSTASITGTISQNPVLAINGLVTPVTCFNDGDGAVNITATGGSSGYQYYWTTLNGSGVQPLNEDQINLSKGTYTVAVWDANNCADTADFIVTEPEPISYDGTVVGEINLPATDGFINLLPAGGNYPYTFVWTGPNGFTAFSEDIGSLADGGLYNLELTDLKNCTSDTSFLVDDKTTLIAQIVAKTDILCFGGNNGTATVSMTNGTPPYSYDWGPLGTIIVPTRVGMTAGDYIVTVTDNNSQMASASVSILGPSAALNPVLDPQELICYNDLSGVMDLTVFGGTLPYSYNWENVYFGEDLVNVPADVYTVIVTDGNGCWEQRTAEVTQPAAIALSIGTPLADIKCHGDRTAIVTATASGGTPPGSFSYQWDDPGAQTTQTAFELEAGTYNVVVTDGNGCTNNASIIILEPGALTISTVLNDPSCAGLDDGSIIPTVTGGTGGYDYIWSNNFFDRLNTDIPAGTYILTLNDNNNCVLIDTFQLADPEPMIIDNIVATDASCLGLDNGSIEINANGGDGAYEYSVDGGISFINTPIVVSLTAGNYTVLVRDGEDCYAEEEPVTLIYTDTVEIVSVEATDLSCSGLADGSLVITADGGDGTYEYSTDAGLTFVTTSTISSLAAGDYQVIVKDGNECLSETDDVTLNNADVCDLIIYDAFSPNGDQYNNVWNIGNASLNIKVKIFNLWGKLVFTSSGYSDPWDGTFEGKALPSGTYYYVIDPGDGSEIITGDVSIVK